MAFSVLPYLWVLVRPSVASFAQDSWSYYDLSRTIFDDFYRPATTRDYNQHDGYSRSFPPLWPIVIGLADRVFHSGPAIAVSLAALAALATIIPIRAIVNAAIPRRHIAPIATCTVWLSLLGFGGFWYEVGAGQAIPITILMQLGAIAFLMRRPSALWLSIAAGFLLGCAALTRFDALPFGCLAMAIALIAPGTKATSKIAMILAFGVAISPWTIYSKKHYNTFWASDNTAVALNAYDLFILDYRRPPETVFTHPLLWARRIGRNSVALLQLTTSTAPRFYPLSPLFAIAIWVVWKLARWPAPPTQSGQKWLLLFFGVAYAGLVGQVLTGYMELRYFTLTFVLATCWLACAIFSHVSTVRAPVFLSILVLLIQSSDALWRTQRELRRPYYSFESLEAAARKDAPQSPQAVVLAASCTQYGALTHQPTVCLPSDWTTVMTRMEQEEFLSAFHVTHALIPASQAEWPFTTLVHTPQQIVPIAVGLERWRVH